MSKKNLIIASIWLVFLLITFRVGFDVDGVNQASAVAETQRVQIVGNLLKDDVSFLDTYLTQASARGSVLVLEQDLANVRPGKALLLSTGVELLPRHILGNLRQKSRAVGQQNCGTLPKFRVKLVTAV